MEEIDYYNKAKEYLLSFDQVTEEILNAHIYAWKHQKPSSMNELFKKFILHARNRQGMPNSIGNIDGLSEFLFEFDHLKVLEAYECWEQLFIAINAGDFRPPGKMDITNTKSYWVIFCKSIMSIAEFLSAYNSLDEFHNFVNGFLTNEQSKLALPLLLSEEIFGFGFALSCDLLKENVSPEFVKPDTHLNYIARGLGISCANRDYKIFKDVEAYCARIGVTPYAVDKVFWLVGSGDFYLSKDEFKIKSSKQNFVKSIKN